MSVRVRFAPSPTGHVHIGNIRAAIFNWLFARHEDGAFLLRVEDTDRERSTPEAIATLVDAMSWLGLEPDEEPLYQSSQLRHHLAAAEHLIAEGHAYRHAKGGGAEAVLFRIPWAANAVPGVETVGPCTLDVHPDVPVVIDRSGITFAGVSKKGKPVESGGCLAGFRDLDIYDADDNPLFFLNDKVKAITTEDASFTIQKAVRFRFTRRQIHFHDLVKGEMIKPLDSMKDQVIVRSDGSPVFHLANVCDDMAQHVTHIIRGDDHVENTYRHIFLFHALGATPPQYAHLPMIVNAAGKPYSKRDGDAFVGDFRAAGYLPEALFNHLALLGWSPGDDREKMGRDEIVAAFTLDRVQQAAAQMNQPKLDNLNAQYMAEMPVDAFVAQAASAAAELEWFADADSRYFRAVAELMQSRLKRFTGVAEWDYFFVDCPEYDAKGVRKFLQKPGVDGALRGLRQRLADLDFADQEAIQEVLAEAAAAAGIEAGKFNQPVRVAITGRTVGAGVYETMAVLGRERVLDRLDHVLEQLLG